MKRTATVEFSGSHPSCFASISWSMTLRGQEMSVKVLKLETLSENPLSHFVSVIASGGSATKSNKDVIKLHPRFANSLGLHENEQVFAFEVTSEPAVVQRASVSCVSPDDWEILESNAEIVTNQLLSQLRVIYPGLRFPFWVTKTMSINLKIDNITPSGNFGILASQSEIVIPSLTSHNAPGILQIKNYLRLRIHPIVVPDNVLCLLPSSSLLIKNVYHAFVHKCSILESDSFKNYDSVLPQNSSFSATVFRGEGETSESGISSTANKTHKLLNMKVFFIETCDLHPTILKYFPVTNPPCIYLHSELIKKQSFSLKSYIWIKQTEETSKNTLPGENQSCQLALLGNPDVENLDDFMSFRIILEDNLNFLKSALALGNLRHGCLGPEFGSLLIEGKQGSGKSWLASKLAKTLEGHPHYVHWELINCAKWRGKKAETMEKELKSILEQCSLIRPAIVILDDLDVLTPMAKSEQQNLQEEFLHYKICETLLDSLMQHKGQQLSIICTAVSKEGLNSYWKSRPGFHFFQKVTTIPPPNELERLAIFQKCLHRYQKNTESALPTIPTFDAVKAATTKLIKVNPKKSTNAKLTSTESCQSKAEQLIPEKENSDNNVMSKLYTSLSTIHDQYSTPQLIHNLARSWAIHLSSTGVTQDISEQFRTLEKFIQDEIKFCDDGAQKSSGHKIISWDSIGGLHMVKNELTKILEWPIKYAKVFKNAPIKLPSGILLYGYPGTGKTLMGLSIPSLVNAKFIHIKGPELLSKYIGASEQAVQDVFKRARNSSPCIIFFDEFDSLVPRRGHDSTGVTDRVVNQFLAEMDGIEGGLGEGVYLIGATSRPDLIDPAVLRPGRLDKHLFFDLPDVGERKEIVKMLGRQVNLHIDDDDKGESDYWDEIGRETEGFTGADIHSLVFSSQLAAVQRYLDKLELNESSTSINELPSSSTTQSTTVSIHPEITSADIPVTKSDLKETLSTFKPSLQGKEFKKFKFIFENFSGNATKAPGRDEASSSWIMETGKRATLA